MKQITGPSIARLDARYLKLTGGTLTGALTIQPTVDTLSALLINDTDGNTVLSVDTVNNYVGIPIGLLVGSTSLIAGTVACFKNTSTHTRVGIDGHTAGLHSLLSFYNSGVKKFDLGYNPTATQFYIYDGTANIFQSTDAGVTTIGRTGGSVIFGVPNISLDGVSSNAYLTFETDGTDRGIGTKYSEASVEKFALAHLGSTSALSDQYAGPGMRLYNAALAYTAFAVKASNNWMSIGFGNPAAMLHVRGNSDNFVNIIQANATQTAALVQHQTSNADVHNEFFVAHASNLYTTVFNKQGSPLLDFKVLSDTVDAIWVDASAELVTFGTEVNYVGAAGVPFGHCYGNEIAWTQASAAQNTWYDISDSDMISGELHQFTHDGNGQLTALKAGKYTAVMNGAFEASAANIHVQIAFSVNGTERPVLNHFETVAATRQLPCGVNDILDLSANDTVNISIRTTDAGTPTLSADHLIFELVQVGGT